MACALPDWSQGHAKSALVGSTPHSGVVQAAGQQTLDLRIEVRVLAPERAGPRPRAGPAFGDAGWARPDAGAPAGLSSARPVSVSAGSPQGWGHATDSAKAGPVVGVTELGDGAGGETRAKDLAGPSERGGLAYDAILVLSFGGPEGPDDVMPFLERVTGGRGVPRERLEEVAQHYLHFGGVSPINAQTATFLDALRRALEARGIGVPVYWGNRNWHPLLEDTVAAMERDGVGRAIAYATSTFSSYPGCRQYLEDLERARLVVGPSAPIVDKLVPCWDQRGFLEAVRDRALEGLDALPADARDRVELVFTAHSIPLSMASTSDYEAELAEASAWVAAAVDEARRARGLAGELEWSRAWQSRSGPPAQPWLEPDICDHLREVAKRATGVVVVPIGFVSDHMEVAYDLDLEAAAVAESIGLPMVRAGTVGVASAFLDAVADLLAAKVEGRPVPAGIAKGGARPDPCSPGCCPRPPRPAPTRP